MESKWSTGSILGIVGGIGLAISAFLNWGTVTLDAGKLASALGIDPSVIPPGSIPGASQSVTGTDGWEGKVAIAAGVVAVVVAIFAMREARKGLGVLLIVAGIVGGGVALYDVITVNDQKDSAIEDMTPQLQAAGIQPSQLSDAIDVSLDAGIWICIVAGIVVIAGGAMVRSREGAASAAATSTGLGTGMGTGIGSPTPPAAAPATMTPPAPSMPAPEPSPPPGGGETPPGDGETDGTA
jgi:hypothetical protein